MERLLLCAALLCFGCSSDNNDSSNADMAAAEDVGGDVPTAPDAGGEDTSPDEDMGPTTFCETVECSGDTPVCSELIGACVECASNNDCGTAPLLTCETLGVGGEDPTFECVECVDDSVCGGGTCDLETHTCM